MNDRHLPSTVIIVALITVGINNFREYAIQVGREKRQRGGFRAALWLRNQRLGDNGHEAHINSYAIEQPTKENLQRAFGSEAS